MTEYLLLIIAIFSAIATGLAAVATWRAPLAAAKLAEALRRNSDRDQERQKNKLHLFTTVMQERAAIYSEAGVRSLNLIDVVFNESRAVRDAWAELEPDSKDNYRASRLTAIWMQASVTKAARVRPRFS